jgi:tetratricopeptide (TPR) repeat protein
MREEWTPKQQAQELAYEAMDARTGREALALARRALKLDPDCSDALWIVAKRTAQSNEDYIHALQAAVAAAERSLGPRFRTRFRGSFWGEITTRPYMRVRLMLAEAYINDGQYGEAQVELEGLLRLNPRDNQGVRYMLLACYGVTGNLAGMQRLYRKYPNDYGAEFYWLRPLERLLAGDEEGARKAFARAEERSRAVWSYLIGRGKLPARLPCEYALGSLEEAQCVAAGILPAWKSHPAAFEWLCWRGRHPMAGVDDIRH